MTLEQAVLQRLRQPHDADCVINEGYACDCELPQRTARDLAVCIERSWRETGVINWEHKWDEGYAAAIAAFVGGDE